MLIIECFFSVTHCQSVNAFTKENEKFQITTQHRVSRILFVMPTRIRWIVWSAGTFFCNNHQPCKWDMRANKIARGNGISIWWQYTRSYPNFLFFMDFIFLWIPIEIKLLHTRHVLCWSWLRLSLPAPAVIWWNAEQTCVSLHSLRPGLGSWSANKRPGSRRVTNQKHGQGSTGNRRARASLDTFPSSSISLSSSLRARGDRRGKLAHFYQK